MTTFEIPQYDDLPVLDEVIVDGDNNPVDLTNADRVILQTWFAGSTVINRDATIMDQTTDPGRVQVKLTGGPTGETGAVRLYKRQWLIVWGTGDTQRVPTNGTDYLLISPATGPNPS